MTRNYFRFIIKIYYDIFTTQIEWTINMLRYICAVNTKFFELSCVFIHSFCYRFLEKVLKGKCRQNNFLAGNRCNQIPSSGIEYLACLCATSCPATNTDFLELIYS